MDNGIVITLSLRVPPNTKRKAKNENWAPIRTRIVEALVEAGLQVPYGGDVHLHVSMDDKATADIDNRLTGIFSLLDSTGLRGCALRDDGQIRKVIAERRYFAPNEDFSVKITPIV